MQEGWLAHTQAKETASAAVQRVAAFNRRTLDGITSKLYFYFSWTHECTDSLADIRGCASLPLAIPALTHTPSYNYWITVPSPTWQRLPPLGLAVAAFDLHTVLAVMNDRPGLCSG